MLQSESVEDMEKEMQRGDSEDQENAFLRVQFMECL